MLFYSILILAIPLQIWGCEEVSVVPQLQKRSRIYTASITDGYVDDGFLRTDWYSAFYEKQQYLMPDKNSIPSLSTCGGTSPIYLQDVHPDVNSLGENAVIKTVCIRTEFNVCDFTVNIKIRKCNGEIQYFLVSTFQQFSAYCFDSPDIYGVAENGSLTFAVFDWSTRIWKRRLSDFQDAPTGVAIGKVTVKPELEHIDRLPKIKILCEVSSVNGQVSNLIFHTLWYINQKLMFYITELGKTIPLTETELNETGLGKDISCGVRLSSSKNGKMTPVVASQVFFAGIKVLDTDVSIVKNADDTKIRLNRTLPFGCRQPTTVPDRRCTLSVQMLFTDACADKGNIANREPPGFETDQKKCGVAFQGLYQGDSLSAVDSNADMMINTIDLTLDDQNSYTLQLKIYSNIEHPIWNNYILEPIQVTVHDDLAYKGKICRAQNDPHMTTFKGYSYEHQHPGDFILYRNVKYQTDVHIRLKLCNSNIAWCTCAIAIRAGADVFRMNYCSNNKSEWTEKMTSCKDKGILVVNNKNDVAEILTPIGTMVLVSVSKYDGLMNVQVRLAPKDVNNADGLCGKFVNAQTNDIVDRNGNPTKDHQNRHGYNFHDTFSSVWSLNANDTNYLNGECQDPTSWGSAKLPQYCVCEKCFNGTTSCSLESEAHCSPSQYLDCQTESSNTQTLCKSWDRDCNFGARRRKRETIRIMHFRDIQLKTNERHIVKKRQTRNITEAEAIQLCTESLSIHPAFSLVNEATEGLNMTQDILNCVYDTFEGQSVEWVESYVSAVTSVVEMNIERDPIYKESHAEDVTSFRRQSCPSNCSGNGICSDEGTCLCSVGFGGSICSIDVTAELMIFAAFGNGLCDIETNECDIIEIRTDDLIRGYVCKVEERKILTDGTKLNINTEITAGKYLNLFTAVCPVLTKRKKRSVDNNSIVPPFASEYDVSISNDGNTFSEKVSITLYDPTCQTAINQPDGSVTVILKEATCFIDGKCYLESETKIDDPCYKCVPIEDTLTWTLGCAKSDNVVKEPGIPTYAIVIVTVVPVVVIAVALTAVLVCKKNKKLPRAVSPGRSKVNPGEVLFSRGVAEGSTISVRGQD